MTFLGYDLPDSVSLREIAAWWSATRYNETITPHIARMPDDVMCFAVHYIDNVTFTQESL